jgi:hypothetical protein
MTSESLDSLMSPVANCLDTVSLRALTELRAAPGVAERMAWLAGRANEGTLTPEERAEYESCVVFASFLGVLQSKARRRLNAAG